MNVLDMIAARLGEPAVQALGQRVGGNRQQTLTAVAYSFPALLGTLAKTAQSPAGASALAGELDRNHDGSVLNNLPGLIQNPASAQGPAIAKGILGDSQTGAAQLIGAKSGLTPTAANSVLETVAPMVMGFLGKRKRAENLDANGLAALLAKITGTGQAAPAAAPQSSGLLGGLTDKLGGLTDKVGGMSGIVDKAKGFIDKDKDGDMMDDIQGMFTGLMGGFGK